MSNIICVTNRSLCEEDFLTRLAEIAAVRPKAVILREKDLTEDAYFALAKEVTALCRERETPCILHSFPEAAKKLNCRAVHLPLPKLRQMTEAERAWFTVLGASCHSVSEAAEAEALGCTYITAGHIFETDCKKGLPGRGLGFLQEVCQSVTIPVYAIGGIDSQNYPAVMKAGAKGACIMSGLMTCEDVKGFLEDFYDEV